MNLGFSINWDCTVDEIDSRYRVLDVLKGTLVIMDQLDYLASNTVHKLFQTLAGAGTVP